MTSPSNHLLGEPNVVPFSLEATARQLQTQEHGAAPYGPRSKITNKSFREEDPQRTLHFRQYTPQSFSHVNLNHHG